MNEFSSTAISDGVLVRLLHEEVYSLTVNGRILASVALLPGMLEAFATGYLITEGLVPYQDIESVMVEKNTIGVLTVNPFKVLLPKRSVISGCGGTASYLDPAKLPVLKDAFTVPFPTLNTDFPEDISDAGGFSAAAVLSDGQVIASASCLSLYSAFDKTVGAAEKAGAHEYAVVCSGKVTADLVRKCLNAGVPVLASEKPPTSLAVRMAEQGNLTLVRPVKNTIYTHSCRISNA
jgi:FdhD protein